jgi:hypothetical protein
MTTENLDSADLKAALQGGIINESVMQSIIDISDIKMPMRDICGNGGKIGNSYAEWTQDKLTAPDSLNAKVDGQALTGNDAKPGTRVGNHAQISTKIVSVSTRARNSDVIGTSDSLGYNVMQRLKELMRDQEASIMAWNPSQADNGDAIPGISASFGSWLTSNVWRGAGSASGGFGAVTPTIVSAPTSVGTNPLSEERVRDISQEIYEKGGNATVFMCRPKVKRAFSEYLYTDVAKVAVLDQDVGNAAEQATAKGAVDVFLSDFSILKLTSNRLQPSQPATPTVSSAYLIDPEHVDLAYLHGFRTEPQAKVGLSDTKQMIVDWTLRVLTEEAHGTIADIDETLPVVNV